METLLIVLIAVVLGASAIILQLLKDIHQKLDDIRFKVEKLDDISESVGSISEIVEVEDRRRSKMRIENEL
jgi:uncharacterized protein YoxC